MSTRFDASGHLHRLDGVDLDVQRLPATGDGRPVLVFLHEGLGSIAQWRDFPAALCARTGCAGLVYSRYGFGRSTPLAATPRPRDYLQHEAWQVLPALLRDLGIERPYLVGHSDGASIALLHAARAPVAGLCAMAPHVRVEAVTLAGIRAAEADHARMVAGLARYHQAPELTFRGWTETWLAPAFRDWNIEAPLVGIAAPALLIQGEDDAYGTLAQLDWIAAAIARGSAQPAVERLHLPGVGHTPWREAPAAVLDAIAAHIEAASPATTAT